MNKYKEFKENENITIEYDFENMIENYLKTIKLIYNVV